MIKIPTLLILGAGASVPYGYPTGPKLKKEICEKLTHGEVLASKDLERFGYDSDQVLAFRDALFKSGRDSVDAFLEHRQDMLEIGKFAIAHTLIKYESEKKLFEKGDWYEYLYNKMNTSFERFDDNEIYIITFNYDRSLEYFLFTSLKNSYTRSEEECAMKVSHIPIVHLHGELDKLPWQSEVGREYGFTNDPIAVKKAASGIRIIHDDIDLIIDHRFSYSLNLLKKAERVYFLGFGYHEENVKRLRLPNDKIIKGTAYEMSGTKAILTKKLFNEEIPQSKNQLSAIELSDTKYDILGFFENAVVLE